VIRTSVPMCGSTASYRCRSAGEAAASRANGRAAINKHRPIALCVNVNVNLYP
jgi:hypothetical protein